MAELKDVLKVVLEQIDKKVNELKIELHQQRDVNQAIATLDSRAAQLKGQITALATLPIPTDLLEFYTRSGGRVWVSKLCGFRAGEHFAIQHNARTLNYPEPGTYGAPTFDGLRSGSYRFVLLAIEQDIPDKLKDKRTGQWTDEYNDRYELKEG